MDFEFSEEEQAFRARAARDIATHAGKPGVRSNGATPGRILVDSAERREFMKALAEGGYLGLSWPTEYGGQGLSPVYDYLLAEELALQGAPGTGKGVGIVGRTIMTHGTDEQKATFLPRILSAEIEWALGYTEPEAGSDLANISLRATRVDGGWRLNGQKRFTTSAHFADWYFMAARTSTEARRHEGITLFLIDFATPGIEINPITCIDGERTNEVFLDDVFVPDSRVVGEVGRGFYYMSAALDYERHILYPVGALELLFGFLVDWVRNAVRDGVPVREDPEIRALVAKLATDLEICKLMSYNVLAAPDAKTANVGSAMNKIVASDFFQALAVAGLETVGAGSWLSADQPMAEAEGIFEHMYRAGVLQSLGAGSVEIQRNIIARRGLGLPNPT